MKFVKNNLFSSIELNALFRYTFSKYFARPIIYYVNNLVNIVIGFS